MKSKKHYRFFKCEMVWESYHWLSWSYHRSQTLLKLKIYMSKEMNMCKLGKIHPNRVEWFLELPKTFIFFSQNCYCITRNIYFWLTLLLSKEWCILGEFIIVGRNRCATLLHVCKEAHLGGVEGRYLVT